MMRPAAQARLVAAARQVEKPSPGYLLTLSVAARIANAIQDPQFMVLMPLDARKGGAPVLPDIVILCPGRPAVLVNVIGLLIRFDRFWSAWNRRMDQWDPFVSGESPGHRLGLSRAGLAERLNLPRGAVIPSLCLPYMTGRFSTEHGLIGGKTGWPAPLEAGGIVFAEGLEDHKKLRQHVVDLVYGAPSIQGAGSAGSVAGRREAVIAPHMVQDAMQALCGQDYLPLRDILALVEHFQMRQIRTELEQGYLTSLGRKSRTLQLALPRLSAANLEALAEAERRQTETDSRAAEMSLKYCIRLDGAFMAPSRRLDPVDAVSCVEDDLHAQLARLDAADLKVMLERTKEALKSARRGDPVWLELQAGKQMILVNARARQLKLGRQPGKTMSDDITAARVLSKDLAPFYIDHVNAAKRIASASSDRRDAHLLLRRIQHAPAEFGRLRPGVNRGKLIEIVDSWIDRWEEDAREVRGIPVQNSTDRHTPDRHSPDRHTQGVDETVGGGATVP